MRTTRKIPQIKKQIRRTRQTRTNKKRINNTQNISTTIPEIVYGENYLTSKRRNVVHVHIYPNLVKLFTNTYFSRRLKIKELSAVSRGFIR